MREIRRLRTKGMENRKLMME